VGYTTVYCPNDGVDHVGYLRDRKITDDCSRNAVWADPPGTGGPQPSRRFIVLIGTKIEMLRQFSTNRIVAFFLLDWLGTLGMLVLAGLMRTGLGDLPHALVTSLQALGIPLHGFMPEGHLGGLSPQVVVLVSLIWPFFFSVFSVYDGRRNETLKVELLNVFMAICVSTVTLAGVLYLTYRDTPRVLFLMLFFLDVFFLIGIRVVLSTYRQRPSGRWRNNRRIAMIVGAGPVGQQAAENLQKYTSANLDIIGYVDDDLNKQGRLFAGKPVLGGLDEVPELIKEFSIQDALVALPLRAHERLVETCRVLQELSVRVHVIPDFFALSFPNATMDRFAGIPIIELGQPGIDGQWRLWKRVFDTIAVSLGLLILFPLFLIIAVMIKLDSPGPVIYKQRRIGEHGRDFIMYKFRSMHIGTDIDLHREYVTVLIRDNIRLEQISTNRQASLKMQNDPRITRVGRFIRKTSLDELPQLFNVLRGEMSLVGPRPDLPYAVEVYKDWYKRRFTCLPGITGWWQVKGRNLVPFDEMVRMDIYYIEHTSLWLDLKILFLTPWAVISGRGAG
jgi:exopolysaccharide biosynthesis polyprenyl glycosylphosphotransferase